MGRKKAGLLIPWAGGRKGKVTGVGPVAVKGEGLIRSEATCRVSCLIYASNLLRPKQATSPVEAISTPNTVLAEEMALEQLCIPVND